MPADGSPSDGSPENGHSGKNANGASRRSPRGPASDPEGTARRSAKKSDPPAEPETARTRARSKPYDAPYDNPTRKPAAERENSFNSMAWMLEGATGLIEELRHNDMGLPEEFWVHAYAARREALLALRAALDDLIEKSGAAEQQEQEKQKRRDRRGGIDIEF